MTDLTFSGQLSLLIPYFKGGRKEKRKKKRKKHEHHIRPEFFFAGIAWQKQPLAWVPPLLFKIIQLWGDPQRSWGPTLWSLSGFPPCLVENPQAHHKGASVIIGCKQSRFKAAAQATWGSSSGWNKWMLH